MRRLVLAIIAAASPLAPADILHLRDGSRHYGELVSQSQSAIVFRVALDAGGTTMVRTFPADLVARVERTGRMQTPPAAPEASPVAAPPAADYEQMLREACELLDDNDRPAALRAMQRIALEAPAATLAQLDAQCRAARGVPLDELLAQTRLQAAAREGHEFRIRYATPYERAALSRLLAEQQRTLLARRHDGRTVADWAADYSAYHEVRPDARQLVADAARAAATIAAQLRFDPELADQRAERTRLVQQRAELSRLAAHVLALPGYTAAQRDDPTDPTRAAAEQLATQPAPTPADPNRADDDAPNPNRARQKPADPNRDRLEAAEHPAAAPL